MSLKAYRLNAGWSVAELAEVIEMTPAAIYYMERAGSRPRDAAKAKQIADLFHVKVTDIWPVDAVAAERRADMLHDLDRSNSTVEEEAA